MIEKTKINTFLSCQHSSNLNLPQSTLKYSIAKGDRSNHYFCTKSPNTLLNVCPDPYGPIVTLPNNETIRATHQGHLPFAKHLSPQATKTSIFPNLHNNLISVGQLCDDGCTVTFTKSTMTVAKNSKTIFSGHRSTSGDGLWNINLHKNPPPLPPLQSKTSSQPSAPSLNVILRKSTPAKDLAIYLHAACFSPAKHTFLKAIKNNHFIGWPGLSASLISKHLPLTIATAKGHIKQERQGLQSTSKANLLTHDMDMYPTPDVPNIKTHDVIYSITSK